MSRRNCTSALCLAALLAFGAQARALDITNANYNDTTDTAPVSGEQVNINNGASNTAVFENSYNGMHGAPSLGGIDFKSANAGTTTFEQDVRVTDSIEINGSGTTKFLGNVTTGSGATSELYITGGTNSVGAFTSTGALILEKSSDAGNKPGKDVSTNSFGQTVTLHGHTEALTDFAAAVSAGTNTFKNGIDILETGKKALFHNSDNTIYNGINYSTGSGVNKSSEVIIGYDKSVHDTAAKAGHGDLMDPNATTKITLESTGTTFNWGPGRVYIKKGAVVETNVDTFYDGGLYIRDDAQYTAHSTATGGGTWADRIYIGDETTADGNFTGKAVFEDNVYAAKYIDISGSGTTTFEKNVSIGEFGGKPTDPTEDYDIFISGGTNTFKGNVYAGSLTIVSTTDSVNVFNGEVVLNGSDKDKEGFLDHAVAIAGGKNTFEKGFIASYWMDNDPKDVLLLHTETTIYETIGNAKNITIGYDEAFFADHDQSDHPGDLYKNAITKIVLDAKSGTPFIMGAGRTYVNAGATVEAKVDTHYNGALYIRDNAQYHAYGKTTGWGLEIGQDDVEDTGKAPGAGTGRFTGNAVFDKDVNVQSFVNIYGSGTTTFNGELNIGDVDNPSSEDCDLIITGGTNTFNGEVSARYMAVDNFVGKTVSTNVFREKVDLWGEDEELEGYSLTLFGGDNTFVKGVDTNGYNAAFMNTTTTFNGDLNTAGGVVEIGVNDAVIKTAGPTPAEEAIIRNSTANVILGNNAKITAREVSVLKGGALTLLSNATIAGNASFANGSALVIGAEESDGVYGLTVTGSVDIETGATATVLGLDPTKTKDFAILTAQGGLDGMFALDGLSLYKLRADGDKIVTDGRNSVADIIAEVPGIGNDNAHNGAQLIDIVFDDANADRTLQINLGDSVTKALSIADTDMHLGQIAFSQLFAEYATTGASASYSTAQNFSSGIMGHQTQLRDTGMADASDVSAPSGYASLRATNQGYSSSFNPNRIWAGGFGAWTRQKDKDNQFGYKYNSGGFILGYDREVGNMVFGISSAYSNGRIKNNEGYTKTDVDTFNVGLYASYNHCSGFFADLNAGFGYAWNKVKTNDVINGGTKEGKYRNTSLYAGLKLGYDIAPGNGFHIIPSVGVDYTHVRQNAWSERVQNAGQIANWFDKTNSDYVSIPIGVRLNKTFVINECASITPEIRGSWIYEAKDPKSRIRMGYVGSGASTTLYGIDSGRSRGLVGAGLKAKIKNIDAFVDYNYEFRSGYKNHNVMAGLGLSF